MCPPRVSVSPSPLGVEKLNPSVLQSQIPWGFPVPFLEPQAGKPDVGLRTSPTVGGLPWYHHSPVCGLATRRVWDLIFNVLAPSFLLCCGFVFVSGCGAPFWWVPVPRRAAHHSCTCGALAGGAHIPLLGHLEPLWGSRRRGTHPSTRPP